MRSITSESHFILTNLKGQFSEHLIHRFPPARELCPPHRTTFNRNEANRNPRLTSNPDTPNTMPASVHSQDEQEHDQSMMDVENAEEPVNPILLDEKRIVVVSRAPRMAREAAT